MTTLHDNPLGGLMALDLPMILITLINILPLIALYAALKQVNKFYALTALVVGLIAVCSAIQSRPLAELVLVSDKYAAATTEAAKSQYLAAGETLLAFFNGTAWMVYTVFGAISGLINSLLMFRSKIFNRTAASIGVISTVPGFGFFIPLIGVPLLFLSTIGSVIWNVLIARAFFRLGWEK